MSKMKAVYDQAAVDPQFRARLKSNPDAVLKEAGVEVPAGKTVAVIESRPNELHLFLGSRSPAPQLDQVLQRADKDAAFKQRLVSNPNAVLAETCGLMLPSDLAVRVHEALPNQVRLLIPAPNAPEKELSDLELESVTGGGIRDWLRSNTNVFCPNQSIGGDPDKPGGYSTATSGQGVSFLVFGTNYSRTAEMDAFM